jgi:hypothetical protein
MIYLMTAFFLDLNNASPVWWGWFITFALLDSFVAFMKWEKENGKS